MIADVCKEVNNYFEKDAHGNKRIFRGTFKISGGQLSPLNFIQNGQYFRITGSAFNDGVYKHPTTDLTDEVFDGAIWAMGLPPAFIALCSDIEKWEKQYGEAVNSPYSSESFAAIQGYSRTLATDSQTGNAINWQSQFRSRLNRWRKI